MGERARIRRIQVSKLFGIFDHEIPLNVEDRVTIIHGPNGYGKTVILQMLDGLFSGRLEMLRHIPFRDLVVELENGGLVRVQQGLTKTAKGKTRRAKSNLRNLSLSYAEGAGGEPHTFEYDGNDEASVEYMTPGERVPFSNTTPFGIEGFISTPIHISHVHQRIKPRAQQHIGWVKALRDQFKLRLIHTQRLGVIGDREPAILTYSSEIAAAIKSLLARYASRSQDLDSTFLDRLLQERVADSLPLAKLHERLRQIEEKRVSLIALGFLDQERGSPKPPRKIDKSKLDVLSVYVDDTEKKLAVFDEMARKVQLLTEAINKRFKYKQMSVSKDEGFVFRSSLDGAHIPLSSLSSGEQHELVLFYELLFKVAPDTLVLIDEPEISLHIAWQKQFLGDLLEMVKLAQFDVLLATHSPDIIGKRWDLTVELEGPDLQHAAE
jgi:ABC-type transport system involved in cytochrome c biogenesis ATPase subunit